MTFNDRKKLISEWLDNPAWEMLKEEIIEEIDTMTQKLINEDGESLQLKADVRARQALLNKLSKYNG